MDKDLAEYYINYSLDCGIDFSELFYEETEKNEIKLQNSRIDEVISSLSKGIGIRLAYKDKISYGDTCDLEKDNILKIIDNLKSNYSKKRILNDVKLSEEENKVLFKRSKAEDKKEFLYKIDKIAKNFDKRVDKVIVRLSEINQVVTIANSKGKYVKDTRINTMLIISVIAKEKEKTATSHNRFGFSLGFDAIMKLDLEKEIKKIVSSAIAKLDEVIIDGGLMPAVIGSNFGGVIFHEAVGHSLEATTVATKVSVLSNKYNRKIASDKVTLVDDGTLKDLSGTTFYDDEGNKTKRNVLIDKGILASYLIDEVNSKKMKMDITGSGRRESYKYMPTSRMNNTYLMPGTDKVEDMIKSIKYGLYAKKMGGGSVNPITGDFNFAVEDGYIIKDGKICEPVKLVSLIGNTLDILKKVEMVSDDSSFDAGSCGSMSGLVNVTVGQPTIKVSSILVGGGKND